MDNSTRAPGSLPVAKDPSRHRRARVRYELKTWPDSFQPIWDGRKTADIRPNDRGGYKEGDTLHFVEWVPGECRLTGRTLDVLVTHVVRGPHYSVPAGHAMLSIRVTGRS